MVLKNKYVVGCLVQFYEIEMLPEYLASCKQMLDGIENPKNVKFNFHIGLQENFEKIDWVALGRDPKLPLKQQSLFDRIEKLIKDQLGDDVECRGRFSGSPFYNIAAYRRDLNHNYCEQVDFVLWGETDSLWPKQTLEIIEAISAQEHYPKFVLNFAGRKNWDKSWDAITHPLFKDVQFQEDDEWTLENEASEKSYMTLERMNEINDIPRGDIEIQLFPHPKADGSCLVISSELIKSGVNIPHALLHCGEDESFLRMAKLIMGGQFVQYHVKNILRVHNRRHPKKRMYVLGEDNPRGFCTAEKKGEWWLFLEKYSKENLENLQKQVKFRKIDEVLKK